MWNKNKNRPDLLAWEKAFRSGGWEKEYLNIPAPTPIPSINENGIMIIKGIDCTKTLLKLFKESEKNDEVKSVLLDINTNGSFSEPFELMAYLRSYPKPIVVTDNNLASFLTSKSFHNKSVKVGDTAYFHKKLII